MRAIIRDDTGGFKAATVNGQRGFIPVLEAEALALRMGLSLAMELGLSSIEVETDSLSLIKPAK